MTGSEGPGNVRADDIVVLVDFDGTITEEDVGVILLKKYSTTDWERLEARFARGEVDIQQNMQRQFSYVPHDADALVEYARTVVSLRPGWEEFVRYCGVTGLKLAIVSGGLDFYVHGLLPVSDPPLDIHSLVAEYTTDAGWQVTLPVADDGNEEPEGFKEDIVCRYRRQYTHVWFIGNGVSDRGAARVADRLWAVEPLLSWCREHGIDAAPFETFDDVRAQFQQLLSGYEH